MREVVQVWLSGDDERQHLADPPPDDTARRWDGTTACGSPGGLTWVPPERVDGGSRCPACTAVLGTAPVLEGDDPGPV
ncbi:MAG: hypothetical protein H0V93_06680 [Euzebyales bacterium]|jgi:hypothetical protein|nr:hypothetical protein [Euzebyales bacterium]